jgi:hypothetical protein
VRPDGVIIHVTMSTADGIPPMAGSNIDGVMVTPIDQIVLNLRLVRAHARQLPRERRG